MRIFNVLGALVTGAGWTILGLLAVFAGYAIIGQSGLGSLPSWLLSSEAFPLLMTVPALVVMGRLLRGL